MRPDCRPPGISLCFDGDSACTHARTLRTCRRAVHFWQVALPKQIDAIDLSQHREKRRSSKWRNHIHGMFKLTLTMWVCRQELQSSKMDLERETESRGRRTRRVGFCENWSWVDRTGHMCEGMSSSLWQCSLKHKRKKIRQWNRTVSECRWQELRYPRWTFITKWTVSRSDLCSARDNYVVNLVPPSFESWSCWHPFIYDVMRYVRCNHRWQHVCREHPQEFNWNRATSFQQIAWMKCLESFLANDSLRKDNRCQQKLTLKTHWLSQFSLSWIFHFLFSLIQPLFFPEDHTLFCVSFRLIFKFAVFFFFFFFSREHDSFNFVSFHTNFERHRQFLIIFFLVSRTTLLISPSSLIERLYPLL